MGKSSRVAFPGSRRQGVKAVNSSAAMKPLRAWLRWAIASPHVSSIGFYGLGCSAEACLRPRRAFHGSGARHYCKLGAVAAARGGSDRRPRDCRRCRHLHPRFWSFACSTTARKLRRGLTDAGPLSALAFEFKLAADILSTAIAPSWDQIGKLGAIVVIRTGLN